MSAEGALRNGSEPGFQLIETLRWEPDGTGTRLTLHLERLSDSARALGFELEEDVLAAMLAKVPHAPVPLRVRIILAREGSMKVECEKFEPAAVGTVWRLATAGTRIWSGDPFLRHKTTRREVYDAARAEFPRTEIDEVILLNERGDACEGTITTLFAERPDGKLLTPPLQSGLLAGVLRAELLAEGRAVEAVLTPDDLRAAPRLFVGNSLRGLIAATFAGRPD